MTLLHADDTASHAAASAPLRVQHWGFSPGRVDYLDGVARQRALHAAVLAGHAPDTLALLEHDAVYTAGVRTASHERPSADTPVVDVDRGGKITWHGPGQLVGYPITHLPDGGDALAFVRRLEQALIAVCDTLGVHARTVDGRTGVWTGPPETPVKIAAIGIRVRRGVTMHGFAVNCDNDIEPFRRIVPCGISDAGVSTLSAAAGRTISPPDIVDAVAVCVAAALSMRVTV